MFPGVPISHRHLAVCWQQQPIEMLDESCFSCTVLSDDCHLLAGVDGQRNPLQGVYAGGIGEEEDPKIWIFIASSPSISLPQ